MERLESFDSSDLMEFITAPQVKLVGTGGAGNNILNRLFSRRVKGVETIALNTDANHLNQCKAHVRKVLGAKVTKGRGAGGDPYIGKRCAEDDEEDIRSKLSDGDIIFVIAGMGGGTGTGSAPVIAKYAKETDAVVGLVAHNLHLEFFPAEDRLFDQDFGCGRCMQAAFSNLKIAFPIIGDPATGAAERK